MAARHDLLAQIGANRRRTIYLMAGFTIFVAGVAAVFDLALAGGPIVLAVAIVVALAMVWTGYFYSDRVAIAVARARPADPTSTHASTTWSRSCAWGSGSRSRRSTSSTIRHRTPSRRVATPSTRRSP